MNNLSGVYGNIFNTLVGNQTIGLTTQLVVRAGPYQTVNPALHSLAAHPFTPNIMAIKIPCQFRNPLSSTLELYTGEKDPFKHLESFYNEMLYLRASTEIMCRAFPRTLKRDTLTWFLRLPPNSIDSWETLYHRFSRHFIIAKDNAKIAHTLAQVKQKEKESLKDYLHRFMLKLLKFHLSRMPYNCTTLLKEYAQEPTLH